MSESAAFGDPLSAPFWEAATRKQLLLQHCLTCSSYQLYPRPFCVKCMSTSLEWAPSSGRAVVYTKTVVHVPVIPQLIPPYSAAVVELEEGPRLTTNLTETDIAIGERVKLAWRERPGMPPFPIFERA